MASKAQSAAVKRAIAKKKKPKRPNGGAKKPTSSLKSPEAQSEDEYDTTDDEQEDAADYCKGGYHLVEIGEVYNGRYQIIRKLGWGHFSTVWLCKDLKCGRFVALKVVKSAKQYMEASLDEIELLRKVATANRANPGLKHVVEMYDSFRISGAHGNHMVMVFEVLGCNLLKPIIKYNYKGLPPSFVKLVTKQVLLGLDYLHTECSIIHTDIKPENILFCVSDEHVKSLARNRVSSKSAVCNAPSSLSKSGGGPMTKNQKKRLKKKLKKHQELMVKEESMISDVDAVTTETDSVSMAIDNHLILPESVEEEEIMETEETDQSTTNGSSASSSCTDSFDLLGPVSVKIADLGNACWINHHFTDDIQTRQYRSLEVIVGIEYGPPADIWSLACMTFELLTGDFLFEPHSGDTYSRDEDHIAHICELLGTIPPTLAVSGRYSREFFSHSGKLKRIHHLRPWSLHDVLVDKYHWCDDEAKLLASFLLPMLNYNQRERATAKECLDHPWLTM